MKPISPPLALLIVISIVIILGVVFVPSKTVHRLSTYEIAAFRCLHTINTAQTQYLSTYGRYAQSLRELGPAPSDTEPSEASDDLIPESLAGGSYAGYVFTMAPTPEGYVVHADPQEYGSGFSRSLFTDHTNVIRQRSAMPASANDPEIQ